MANDGKIYITISDKRGKSGNGTSTPSTTRKKSKDEDFSLKDLSPTNLLSNLIGHDAAHFVVGEAKRVATYSLSNIGNFTGDYQSQRTMNTALNIAGKIAGIATSFAISPLLGVFSIATTATNVILDIHSQDVQIHKQNTEIDRLRALSGLDQTTNGSR